MTPHARLLWPDETPEGEPVSARECKRCGEPAESDWHPACWGAHVTETLRNRMADIGVKARDLDGYLNSHAGAAAEVHAQQVLREIVKLTRWSI